MMKYLKQLILTSFALAIVGITGHSESQAQSSDELVQWIRDRYAKIDVLKADFTQYTTSPFGDALPTNRGTLWLKGNLYRVETDDQTFVTDGKTVWIFDEHENQVLINDYVPDEATFSITDFLANFETEYDIESSRAIDMNGEKHYEMQLRARMDSAFFKAATIWFRASDHLITRMLVTDVNDAVLDFRLDRIEINPDMKSDPFTFVPPGDAEIIDLRS